MKGIAEKQNLCRFAKIFMIIGAVGSLHACVDDIDATVPNTHSPEVVDSENTDSENTDSEATDSESAEPVVIDPIVNSSSCTDGIDNDLDGWLDAADPDCFASSSSDEIGFTDDVCNNGLDDDGDSFVDSDDANCQSAIDDNEAIAVGDILITEFMANPSAVSDTSGEWFELYNNTGADIDIAGWTIADAGGSHLILEALIIAAGDYVVLSRAADDVNGLSPTDGTDYVYGTSLYFSNSGDEIQVINPQEVMIDSILYISADVAAGASTLINGNSWCVSTVLIVGGAGDYGSPSAENEICP